VTVPDLDLDLSAALAEWLPERRWFGSKDRRITRVFIESDNVIGEGDPAYHHLVLRIRYAGTRVEDRYQVPVGYATVVPDHPESAVIAQIDGVTVYDACVDPGFTRLLPSLIATDAGVAGLRFRRGPAADDEVLTSDLHGRVLGVEQSNTSLLYGEAFIMKLFRRLTPGINPDLEVALALAPLGNEAILPPVGWAEMDVDDTPTTLALAQPFLRLAVDGWALATTSVRDLFAEADLHADEVGGDFAGEAERLGSTTADMHRDLARVLPTGTMQRAALRRHAAAMTSRLEKAVAVVPELVDYAEPLRSAFAELSLLEEVIPVQRIHGDLHLGQVLRHDTGWTVLDFEGEPVKSLAERTALDSPFRDVAGMLRSFDYASRHLLTTGPDEPQLAYRATEWAERNREAFCHGYAERSGADPRKSSVLLRAYELDKAVYEVVYEARNRPSWLPIPLQAIARLVS
jgi:maltokinase